jgi:predicted nucleic acid-binding protein
MPEHSIIPDTSCLIALSKINSLDLLQALYVETFITDEIAAEFGDTLPSWIKPMTIRNKNYQQLLELSLDAGEASAIALAIEMENMLLILDDLKGRKEADRLGLRFTGTLGVLVKAAQCGLISDIRQYIDRLKKAGFHLSPAIEASILKRVHFE